MKIFVTRSCQHLMPTLSIEFGKVLIKNFSDGELYVRIEEDVFKKNVCVLASTPSPADTILELYLLLDALSRAGAYIHVFFTYFGYARQDRAQRGEALSAEVLLKFLKTFSIKSTQIIHIHNPQLRTFFDFRDIILLDFFLPYAKKADVIAAPDEGAHRVAQEIGLRAQKEVVVLRKERSAHEKIATIKLNGNVDGKKVLLIDDMISTGGTITRAAEVLQERGAFSVVAAVTHGIFADEAYDRIVESPLEALYVTNTLPQQKEKEKIVVVDCAPLIENFLT